MNESPSGRRRTFVVLAFAAVVVLSGCAGVSSNSDEVALDQDSSAPSNTTTSVQTTETPTGSGDTTSTAAGSESDADVDSRTDSGADGEADTATPTSATTETPNTETTESAPEDDSNAGRNSGGGSSGTDDSSNTDRNGGGSSAGESDDSNPSNTPTEPTSESDACDEYDEQVGPHHRAELESDDEICITEWDDRPYPDSFTVSGVVGNPSGETIDHVTVEVILYDSDGTELARQTDGIDDLGENDRFVVEFEEVFDGEDAPEPDSGLTYRIHATVGSAMTTEMVAETTTETPTETPTETTTEATTTTAPPPTTTVATTTTPVTTATSTEAPSTTEAPTTTTTAEPDEVVEGTVESDGLTSVTSHEIDTSGGDVVVTGTLTNPTDARIDDPRVRVVLYDDEGDEIAYGSDTATEEEPISPLYEPGEEGSFQVTFSDVDPAGVASYTVRSTATDPAEDPATTRADFAVTFIRLSAYDDPVETYLEVTNQKEETVERLDVVVTVYDENGTAIAEHTERITDLAIGETVTFDHQFEVTEDEADRVEVDVPGQDYGFVN